MSNSKKTMHAITHLFKWIVLVAAIGFAVLIVVQSGQGELQSLRRKETAKLFHELTGILKNESSVSNGMREVQGLLYQEKPDSIRVYIREERIVLIDEELGDRVFDSNLDGTTLLLLWEEENSLEQMVRIYP